MSEWTLAVTLPALAAWEATLPGIGRVYDTPGGPATPDVVTYSGDGRPVLIHIAPYQGLFETDGTGGTRPTSHEEVIDEDVILSLLLVGPLDLTQIGTLQARARPFLYPYRRLVRTHSALTDPTGARVALRWRVERYEAGGHAWGGVDHYGIKFTHRLIVTNHITPLPL